MLLWRKQSQEERGLTLVEFMVVLGIIAVIASFAIPNLMRSKITKNEAEAIGVLRGLATAQYTYMDKYEVFGSLAQLQEKDLIEEPIKNGQKNGYYYGEIPTDSEFTYCFGAIPADHGRSGIKEYLVTQTGIVYEASLKSTKISTGTSWSPGIDGIPPEFTTDPKDDANWNPVRD